MWAPHDAFSPPAPDALLWRYLDLAKYVSLLETSALHFSRLDLLGDPFEGSLSKPNVRRRIEWYREPGSSDPDRKNDSLAWLNRHLRTIIYVNCWHCSDYESAAMWETYVQGGEAFYPALHKRRSYEHEREVRAATIPYIQPETPEESMSSPRGTSGRCR